MGPNYKHASGEEYGVVNNNSSGYLGKVVAKLSDSTASIGTVTLASTALVVDSAVLIAGVYSSSTGTAAIRIDGSTHAINTIDYVHHETHAGSHYFVVGTNIMTSTSDICFSVKTPNTAKWAHMLVDFGVTGQTRFDVWEDATIGTDGTAVVARNSNRNSANTSGLTIKVDPTVSNSGTLLEQKIVGNNANKVGIEGAATRDDELVLKQNSTYLFNFTADAASQLSYAAYWYEQTDKN